MDNGDGTLLAYKVEKEKEAFENLEVDGETAEANGNSYPEMEQAEGYP